MGFGPMGLAAHRKSVFFSVTAREEGFRGGVGYVYLVRHRFRRFNARIPPCYILTSQTFSAILYSSIGYFIRWICEGEGT